MGFIKTVSFQYSLIRDPVFSPLFPLSKKKKKKNYYIFFVSTCEGKRSTFGSQFSPPLFGSWVLNSHQTWQQSLLHASRLTVPVPQSLNEGIPSSSRHLCIGAAQGEAIQHASIS